MGTNKNFINLPSISSFKDNINIGDSDHEATYTDVGPKTGLDVNVLNDSETATTPTIVNVTALLANTEYSYALPSNTKRFTLRARGSAKLQMCFASGQSGSNYITIFPGNIHIEKGINIVGITVYFQSSKANEVIEILGWV